MEELIETLESIKNEVKEIEACTIVVTMNDCYTVKLITKNDWGIDMEEL